MIILDTNVLSAMMRAAHEPVVEDWLDAQAVESVWTTTITIFEIRFGLALLPASRRREQLDAAFLRSLDEDLGGRVLPFDQPATEAAAQFAAEQQRAGRPVEIRDLQIAGIVATRQATLATRNTRHFAALGIALANPWQ